MFGPMLFFPGFRIQIFLEHEPLSLTDLRYEHTCLVRCSANFRLANVAPFRVSLADANVVARAANRDC